ncbi:hypothetical protein MTR_4g113120 [Medicago truncatula]|uniref:Uncharacterized protein n=1 Tax=Medicago truncatula TaxID=3880 RepID=G7JU61_MEDTR|nr:hypothetical protein MTR_4g113120 [Medicago truncatula]
MRSYSYHWFSISHHNSSHLFSICYRIIVLVPGCSESLIDVLSFATEVVFSPIYYQSKVWSSGKMTGLESERTRVRAPLVPLEGGKCKYLCKCSLSPKVFPTLDWGTIPSP